MAQQKQTIRNFPRNNTSVQLVVALCCTWSAKTKKQTIKSGTKTCKEATIHLPGSLTASMFPLLLISHNSLEMRLCNTIKINTPWCHSKFSLLLIQVCWNMFKSLARRFMVTLHYHLLSHNFNKSLAKNVFKLVLRTLLRGMYCNPPCGKIIWYLLLCVLHGFWAAPWQWWSPRFCLKGQHTAQMLQNKPWGMGLSRFFVTGVAGPVPKTRPCFFKRGESAFKVRWV